MKLTAPVHILKRKAKDLKRSKSITMAEALNQVAREEGFSSWSLLQSKAKALVPETKEEILDYLNPGDLILIGARPGLGKTTLTLELLLQAIRDNRLCFFFSLEYSHKDFVSKITSLDDTFEQYCSMLKFDFSDEISSDYIVSKTRDTVLEGSLIAIDYLQLLDQQRDKPPIQQQIVDLKKYAMQKKCILIFISQVDRAFDPQESVHPNLEHVRLPNPLDLGLFNKSIFVNNDQIYI